MADQPGAGRLDPETLAAYIDGLLPPEERAKVEAEIATDPENYEWVVHSVNAVDDEAVAMAKEEPAAPPAPASAPLSEPDVSSADTTAPPSPKPQRLADSEAPSAPVGTPSPGPARVLPFYHRRSVQAVVAGLAAAAAALVLVVQTQPAWWQGLRGPSVDSRFAKLVEAVGEERYIEARLTGGFKYGPLADVTRGPVPQGRRNISLVEVAAELQRSAAEAPSPESLHAWGVAQLLLGDASSASATLERSIELRWSRVVASDLAAAYLADGHARGDVARIEQLMSRDGAVPVPETAFNYALALERANELQAATEAWKRARELESDPQWRSEVETHLRRLGAAER